MASGQPYKTFGFLILLTIFSLGGSVLYGQYVNKSGGLPTSILINTYQTDFNQEGAKYKDLGFFLMIVGVSYYFNILTDSQTIKTVITRDYIVNFMKLGIYLSLLFFALDLSVFFRASPGWSNYPIVIILFIAAFLPLIEKATKSPAGFISINLTGLASGNAKKIVPVFFLMAVLLLYAFSNRYYESYTFSDIYSKYFVVIGIILIYLTYGIFTNRRINYWTVIFFMNFLINPRNSGLNAFLTFLFMAYYIHAMRRSDFDLYGNENTRIIQRRKKSSNKKDEEDEDENVIIQIPQNLQVPK